MYHDLIAEGMCFEVHPAHPIFWIKEVTETEVTVAWNEDGEEKSHTYHISEVERFLSEGEWRKAKHMKRRQLAA